jgi:hypothetical protein
MRYKLLGRTGLRVSELCLGAMIFGDTRGSWGVSGEEASQIASGFPLDFGGARLAYGETFELIDDHRGLVDPLV